MPKPAPVAIEADLSGLAGFAAAVGGLLNAVQSNKFQGDFATHSLKMLRKKFMIDTQTAAAAGNKRIQHVYEWGEQDGNGVATGYNSVVPLFALNIKGSRQSKYMTYNFLPSTKPVPLPDPAKYGFDTDKGPNRRAIFRLKAVVMETVTKVNITPVSAKALFIPDAGETKGFHFANSATINPGGGTALGGFSEWWTAWFEGAAEGYIKEETKATEELLKKTGQKVIRDATTGRFTRGKVVTMGYINSQKRNAELQAEAGLEAYMNEGDFGE